MLTKLLDRLRGLAETPDDDREQLLPIAAATLLLEVAWADHDISEDEIAVIEKALTSQFQLSADAVADIVAQSRAEHDEAVGVHEFTRTLVDAFDEQRRFELLTHLWRIAYSDASLDRFEEHTIRRISELLYVSHTRFIEAKRLARDGSD
jgi:uncharacterized tellurite resistance protein B-like protein